MRYVPIVIIESPYKGIDYSNLEINMKYLRAAIRDCLLRDEAPFASHALYTLPDVLDDTIKEERELGIRAGFTFREVCDLTAVYNDLGVTPGMLLGIEDAKERNCKIEYRSLPEWKGFLEKSLIGKDCPK